MTDSKRSSESLGVASDLYQMALDLCGMNSGSHRRDGAWLWSEQPQTSVYG